jgi:hypothetical protein
MIEYAIHDNSLDLYTVKQAYHKGEFFHYSIFDDVSTPELKILEDINSTTEPKKTSKKKINKNTFNDVKHLYSMVTHRCIEIDGISNFSSLVVKGYNMLSVVSEKGSYMYNLKYDSYFKYNDNQEFDLTSFRNGLIINNINNENNPEYQVYSVDSNTFLSVDGVNTFDSFENLLYGRMVVLAKYSDEPKMWLYNTSTNNFCESENIPIDNSDIEIYSNGILLFWGDNDVLTCYDYEKNIVNSLPITIQKQDAHGKNFNKGVLQDKERQAISYIINGVDLTIYILENLRTIIYPDPKTEEIKRYDF